MNDAQIVFTTANLYHQELYEPLWDEILQRCQSSGLAIRSIWIADVAHQGQSGVLNEGNLGNDRR